MIMDEPTNNLGVPEQHKVLELIRKLRDQGVPVILITHTLPDVFAVSDRLMVMHRGRKVTEKRTADTEHRRSWCSTWSARSTTRRRTEADAHATAEQNAERRHGARKWIDSSLPPPWLLDQASDLFAFFERHSIDPRGGFFVLDDAGEPIQRYARPARRRRARST